MPRASVPSAMGYCKRLALGGLWFGLASLVPGIGNAADAPDAQGMAVSVVPVRRQCLHDLVSASGIFMPLHEAEVRADRDGLMVGEVFVEPGDAVVADQVMARLVSPQGAPKDTMAVKAPIKGTVVAVVAPVGSYASPSAHDPMFRIVGQDMIELSAGVQSSEFPRLRVGMPAKVHVVGLGDLDGSVSSLAGGVDATTQSGTASIVVSDNRLRVGAFAHAYIDAGEVCALTVPLSALLTGPEGTAVEIVRSNRVETRRVSVGLLEQDNAEVREGLREGDQVVARAGAFLRDGDPVRPVSAASPGARVE